MQPQIEPPLIFPDFQVMTSVPALKAVAGGALHCTL